MTGPSRFNFSGKIKDELSRIIPGERCCRLAELSAILRMDGAFHIVSGREEKYALHVSSERGAVARKVIKLFSNLFGLKLTISNKRSLAGRAYEYVVYIPPQSHFNQTLNELGILNDSLTIEYGILPRLVKKDCCKRAYLRGAFLGGGFISNPRGEYHFEITTENEEFTEGLLKLLKYFGFKAKSYLRRENFVIYLSRVEEIVNFLTLVGAYGALLELEDVRIVKELRNQVNRLVNCETANLSKTVRASSRQLADIVYIEEVVGLNTLSKALREVAYARLKNPQASIKELGESMNPSLSKSCVYHRLRRISNFARKLKRAS